MKNYNCLRWMVCCGLAVWSCWMLSCARHIPIGKKGELYRPRQSQLPQNGAMVFSELKGLLLLISACEDMAEPPVPKDPAFCAEMLADLQRSRQMTGFKQEIPVEVIEYYRLSRRFPGRYVLKVRATDSSNLTGWVDQFNFRIPPAPEETQQPESGDQPESRADSGR